MKSIVYLVTTNGMGSTSEKPLKHKLITTFLTLSADKSLLPTAICFYTDGVKLACEGSPVIDQLKALQDLGVRLILCQTCLRYFDLEDQVKVGIVGGMGDILTAMTQADQVITL